VIFRSRVTPILLLVLTISFLLFPCTKLSVPVQQSQTRSIDLTSNGKQNIATFANVPVNPWDWLQSFFHPSRNFFQEYIGHVQPAWATSNFGLTSSGSTTYPTAKVVTPNGNAQIDTSQSKLGGASGLFDGTGDYLTIPDSADWNFGSGNFTVDFWIRFTSIATAQHMVEQYVDGTHFWELHKRSNLLSNKLEFKAYKSDGSVAGNYVMTNAWSLSIFTWYHLAAVRSGASFYIFIDGVPQALTETTAFGTNAIGDLAASLYIGEMPNNTLEVWGRYDEVRISKGARWTSNFSASLPTVRYDRDSATVLLLHMDGADESPTFLDDVTTGQALFYKFTLTETGSPTSMSVYSHAAGNMRGTIFIDSSGPSSKVCETADTAVTATAWTSPDISGCGTLSAANYWLGLQWNPGAAYLAGPSYTAGSANYGYRLYMAYGAFPSSGAGGTLTGEKYSIYVTYSTIVTITFALSGGVSNDATGTIIAIDGTNYVYADFPKAFSWTIGSTKSVTATDPVPAGTGKQYDWTQWTNGDGLSTASGTYTVPAAAITVTAVYATQWYLTVTSSYGSPTGQAWYTNGNSASSSVTSPESGGTGIQYVCTGWTGTGSAPASGSSANTGLFTMSAVSSVTWSWKTQYQIAFTSSGISTDTSGTVVTVNTAAKIQSDLPFTAWYDSGSSVVYAFTSPVAATSGKRYVWSSTSGLSQTLQSNTFSASATGTVTATYHVEWEVTVSQSGLGTDIGAVTVVVVNTVNKAKADLPFVAWYDDATSISYEYTLNIAGSTYQYVWISSSGCGMTGRSGSYTATNTCTLLGNYGVVGGTATVTTTVVQTTTTGTTATATTTTATTATTTATYTSVTVAVTLTSQTITSITISTSYTSLTLPPGLIPNQPNYNQAALGVDGLILVMNQTQVVYADVTIRFYGSGEFLIDNVEFQEPLGEVHWVTLNETMQGSCGCYKQVAGTDSVKLRVKLAPGLDIQPGVHIVSMLVQGKTGDGLALGNTGWLAITISSILPAQAIAIPSPTLTQAGAAVSAGVALLVLIGTAMRRPKDSAGA